MRAFRTGRPASIRTIAIASFAMIALLAVPVAAALLKTATMLESATSSIVQNAQSRAIASEAQLALLMYQRISNLYIVTRDPELDETRALIAAQMWSFVEEAREYMSSDAERTLLDEVALYLERYLDERAEAEATSFEIRDVLTVTGTALEDAVDRLEALQDLNEAEVLAAEAETSRWNRIALVVAGASSAVLIGGLLALTVGLSRYVLRPTLELHDTLERFRSGAGDARAPAQGLLEINELAQRFNEMAEALAQQRERQLAFLAGIAHDLRNPLSALKYGIHALAQEQSE